MPIIPNVASKVCRHAPNELGRDFVVGDIHGCYDDFMKLLSFVGFDKTKDRVFSVGDLIDRGEQNVECIDLVYEKWFFATRGNHEDMFINAVLNGDSTANIVLTQNGGAWRYNHLHQQLHDAALALNTLPLIQVVETQAGKRYNIVHAEFVRWGEQFTDADIDDFTLTEHDIDAAMWGRRLYSCAGGRSEFYQRAGELSLTIVGHTPTFPPIIRGQQLYIDGGAVFSRYATIPMDSALVMFELDAEILHFFKPHDTIYETLPLAEVERIP